MPEGGLLVTVETKSRLKGMARSLADTVEDVARECAEDVKEFAQLSMLEPKSGRVYLSHGRLHVASAPGQAPAVDVGTLIGSIVVRRVGPATFYANTDNGYAGFLEYGTRRMLPRPFMKPASRKAATKARLTAGVKVKVALARVPW
jgi:HK97 gp10 family phage protein